MVFIPMLMEINRNVIAIKTFTIEQVKVNKSSITVKIATYAGGFITETRSIYRC